MCVCGRGEGGGALTDMLNFRSFTHSAPPAACCALSAPGFGQSLGCMVAHCLNIDSSPAHSGDGRLNNVRLPGRYWAPAASLLGR